MKRLFLITLVLLLISIFPGFVSAQEWTDPDGTPWSEQAKGFVEAHLGLCVIPLMDIEGVHQETSAENLDTWDAFVQIPGLSAGLGFIPTFGNNGILMEADYSIYGARFHQSVDYEGQDYRGKTTFGFTLLNLQTGYLRYFLDGPWHIYTGPYVGGQLVSINSEINYSDADTVSSSGKAWNMNGGGIFGFYHVIGNGGIGGELRVESSPFQSNFSLKDDFGEIDYSMVHPLQIKIMAVFLLGGL